MAAAIFVLVLAVGAIAAGVGYVRNARAMRGFRSTSGQVLERGVTTVPGGDTREGRWGRGGGYMPELRYRYAVDGIDYTGDRISYAFRGLKRSIAEEKAAAYPDRVEVWYDPAHPSQAYLERHTAGIGWILIIAGAMGALGALVGILAA